MHNRSTLNVIKEDIKPNPLLHYSVLKVQLVNLTNADEYCVA
jgi:hypothetical protein